jgi:hypothetical protein
VFRSIGVKPASEHCDGMEGLISEGSEVAEADGNADARDAALVEPHRRSRQSRDSLARPFSLSGSHLPYERPTWR